MESTKHVAEEKEASHEIIVKADEVDQIGTPIRSPKGPLPLSALTQSNGNNAISPRPLPQKNPSSGPQRPQLKRETSAPAPPPPLQPPPPAPALILDPSPIAMTDSLSLPQLKQLVSQFPTLERQAYAFVYADTDAYANEINEWFQYTEEDRAMVLNTRDSFEHRWRTFWQPVHPSDEGEPSWLDVTDKERLSFLRSLAPQLSIEDPQIRIEAAECLLYILIGVWGITAGLEKHESEDDLHKSGNIEKFNSVQVEWMKKGSMMVSKSNIGTAIFDAVQKCIHKSMQDVTDMTNGTPAPSIPGGNDAIIREQNILLSTLYIMIETARNRLMIDNESDLREFVLRSFPSLPLLLVSTIAHLRWDDGVHIPLKEFGLFWKCTLLYFGDVRNDLKVAKEKLDPRSERYSADSAHPILTASPLDYHLFRQEITSKYPAYNPPLPLVPLELEQKSMLPQLPTHISRETEIMNGAPGPTPTPNVSILHQPVHIATPAPSPPPSPAGPGGKTAKKQNYQTNQNFPMMYPPLDETSNNIGGKGSTVFQDQYVGRKWLGSDIPASIIEAGELYASRMRMSRAMKQLWNERELFMKQDRGWQVGSDSSQDLINNGGGETNGSDASPEKQRPNVVKEPFEEASIEDASLSSRLKTIETFYHDAMPQFQSLVIVMMKAMLKNIQDIAAISGNADTNQTTNLPKTKSNQNIQGQANGIPTPPPPPQISDLSITDLNGVRARELCHKWITGSLFVMLKWFKVSHVLKFEYLTQLLLDSNYVPLALKYFAHQNIEDLVAIKYDRDDCEFFHFCHLNSDHPPLSPTSPLAASEPSSPDQAAPPPIRRHRRASSTAANDNAGSPSQQSSGHPDDGTEPSTTPGQFPRPSVDELGNPLVPLPSAPITYFSFRQFQTSIHLLGLLQKLTRGKAHRILLLVQYKSSQILRRLLRVPDPVLRLYVLKLFKSQVPYCGRKWRQSNMRVITAIYLHCRPELRDEWLAGMHDGHVEGEVDESGPQEWALRGLTGWWQRRVYGDVLKLRPMPNGLNGEQAEGQEVEEEERDFFQRELDEMGWGVQGLGLGEDVAFGEEAPGVGLNGAHDGMPLAGENW